MYDAAYYARCQKRLKEWGAPLDGWSCVEMIDLEDAEFTCELCGYEGIRYLHKMEHPQYFEFIEVGCICAGIMEGDILAAKERDRKLRNRSKRKRNFLNRKWKHAVNGNYYLTYKGDKVFINQCSNGYYCFYQGKKVYQYKGKPIDNFLSACYAAFDLADPIDEVMR